MKAPKDCVCESCVDACKNQPGWFAPGEVEKAALLLGMTTEAFKKKYIIEDYYVGGAEGEITVLAPRKVGIEEDRKRASFGYAFVHAPCVFLKNDRCSIHEAKPYECKMYACGSDSPSPRKDIAKKWETKTV